MNAVLKSVPAIAFLLVWSAATCHAQDFKVAQMASTDKGMNGIAACYSKKLIGHKTTSGANYDPNENTMAHARLPMGTKVRVTNLQNNKSTVVVVNDHMSAQAGGKRHHIITDVSQAVCRELDFPKSGEAKVSLEVVGGPAPN